MLPQGEVLEGELSVAAAEEREESEQMEQGVIGLGFSSDQSRQINQLFTGRSFGKDRRGLPSGSTVRPHRIIRSLEELAASAG